MEDEFRMAGRILRCALIGAALMALSSCNVWAPPAPAADALERGLLVMYPGAFNSDIELSQFYQAFETAKIPYAVEIKVWGTTERQILDPYGAYAELRATALSESERITAYRRAHPDVPIILLGYSAGAATALIAAENLPDDVEISRVIMLSPSVSRGYDVTGMLNHTKYGAVAYSSGQDWFVNFAMNVIGNNDLVWGDTAATFGFDSTDERLIQFRWEPSMLLYANAGGHWDYFLNRLWITDHVLPWITTVE